MLLPGYSWWLRRNGAKARGVVTGFTALKMFGGVTLLVHYPDGTEREVRAYRHSAWGPHVGSAYPVRYDPKHPSRVVIDTAAIRQDFEESSEEMEEQELVDAKRDLRGQKGDEDTLDADAANAASDPELAQLVAEEKKAREQHKDS